MNSTDIQTPATLRVWDRTTKTERELPVNQAEHAVARGLADLVGEGSLPIDRTLRPRDRTLGDGEGRTLVVPGYKPDVAISVPLVVAMRMVRSGMAHYPDAIVEMPHVAALPVVELPVVESVGAAARLRSLAGRVLGGVVL